MPPLGGYFFWRRVKGFEEAGPTEGRVKKCPVDTFLGRGRIHVHPDAPGTGVDGCALKDKKRSTSKVYTNNNKTPP